MTLILRRILVSLFALISLVGLSHAAETVDPVADATPAAAAAPPALQTLPLATVTRTEPVEFKAEYRASHKKGLPFNGTGVRTLTRLGDNRWQMRSDVTAFVGQIEEVANFRWVDGQAVPDNYEYVLSGWALPNRKNTALFDWAAKKVTGVSKRGDFTHDTLPGLLDELSYQLQLAMDIRAGKEEMVYEVVDEGKRKAYTFRIIGTERLKTNAGEVDTIKVEKVRAPQKARHTALWFAPSWQYALVRLSQTEPNGDTYELSLDKLELPNKVIDP